MALVERGFLGGLALSSAGSAAKALTALALVVRDLRTVSADCDASLNCSVTRALADLALLLPGFLGGSGSETSSAGFATKAVLGLVLVERGFLGGLASCEASPTGSGTRTLVDLALVERVFLDGLASCAASCPAAGSGTDAFPA